MYIRETCIVLGHAPVTSGTGSINPFIAIHGVTAVILPRDDCVTVEFDILEAFSTRKDLPIFIGYVLKAGKIFCLQAFVRTFQSGLFTGWSSEGVKNHGLCRSSNVTWVARPTDHAS